MSTAEDKETMKSTLVTSSDRRNNTSVFGYQRLGRLDTAFGFTGVPTVYLCTYCGSLTANIGVIGRGEADSLVLHAEHCMGTTLGVRVANAVAALEPESQEQP